MFASLYFYVYFQMWLSILLVFFLATQGELRLKRLKDTTTLELQFPVGTEYAEAGGACKWEGEIVLLNTLSTECTTVIGSARNTRIQTSLNETYFLSFIADKTNGVLSAITVLENSAEDTAFFRARKLRQQDATSVEVTTETKSMLTGSGLVKYPTPPCAMSNLPGGARCLQHWLVAAFA